MNQTKDNIAVRFPLRWKMSLLAAVLSAVPLSILGAVLIYQSWDVFFDAHKRIHLAVSSGLSASFEDGLRLAQDSIDRTGRALADDSINADERLSMALRMVAGAESIDHVAVYEEDGRFIDVLREKGAPVFTLPKKLSSALLGEAKAEGVAMGEAVLQGDEVRVLVLLPIHGAAFQGIAASFVSLEFLQRDIRNLTGRVFAEHPYDAFLVDDKLRYLVHTKAQMRMRSAASYPLFDGVDLSALQNHHEFMARFKMAGEAYYGTIITMPKRHVSVGIVVPTEAVLGPVYRMFRIVVAFIFFAIVIGIFMAILLARSLTNPLDELAAFARRLAARDFDERVAVATNDEFSVVGAAMNRAAEDLEESEIRIKEETAIRTDLGRYLPVEIVDRVVRREQDMALGGKRQEITVLFADVVSFTPLTEKLAAEDVVAVLNELFSILTEIVFRHGGMIDKFVGDSVMAVWGAPTKTDDHADKALAAAEDMLSWLDVGNRKWQKEFGVEIKLAIGVNSGEAVVGNIGSDTRMEYTAIGDVVNLAARLESVARPSQILLGPRTRELAQNAFPFIDAGAHKLPGLGEAVSVFAIEGDS